MLGSGVETKLEANASPDANVIHGKTLELITSITSNP